MRISSAMIVVAIVIAASPVAYGQVPLGKASGPQGSSAKPSAPAGGVGDRALIPTNLPAIPPPSDALRNLAGGGYADPNHVTPAERSRNSARRGTSYAHRQRLSRHFGRYCYPSYVCGYCYYD
jgi:hypothetical protein